jgi:hypothetical protein
MLSTLAALEFLSFLWSDPGDTAAGSGELHQANALPPVFGPIDAALARSRAEASPAPGEAKERLARLHADPRFVSWGAAGPQELPDWQLHQLHLHLGAASIPTVADLACSDSRQKEPRRRVMRTPEML